MYQVLYRKWRPKTFSDVSGQSHVTSTLKNEIRLGRLGHAYLFTGSRGTGKTTCAKILAKAVNCLNPHDGDPCNECEICRGIDNGSIMDVVEIDAASNNGVDNIRELREAAAFTPASAKYRVYIIDEVHMLSTGAFNALLKTLEEPPAYVLFILATTEVHKLPATILSRCQRFDFHRISPEDISARLELVAKNENMILHHDASLLIARYADGALRDALSILDRCSGDGEITVERVSKSIGLAGHDYLFGFSDAVASCDASAALQLIDNLHNSSCDMDRLCTELISHFRNLMLILTLKNPAGFIITTEDEMRHLMNSAHAMNLETVLHALNVLQTALANIRSGLDGRTELESAMLRLTSKLLDETPEALLDRIAHLEQQVRILSGGNIPPISPKEVSTEAESNKINETESRRLADDAADKYSYLKYEDEPEFLPEDTPPFTTGNSEPSENTTVQSTQEPVKSPIKAVVQPSCNTDNNFGAVRFSAWPDVLSNLTGRNPLIASLLRGSTAYIDGSKLLISCNHPQFRDEFNHNPSYREALKASALAVTGKQFSLGPYNPNLAKENESKKKTDPFSDFIKQAKAKDLPLSEADSDENNN